LLRIGKPALGHCGAAPAKSRTWRSVSSRKLIDRLDADAEGVGHGLAMRVLFRCLLVAGFAPAPFPRTPPLTGKGRPRKMQGTWSWSSTCTTAPTTSRGTRRRFRFTFAGARVSCSLNGPRPLEVSVETSPGSAPRAMTKTIDGGGYVMRAIYRFEATGSSPRVAERTRPASFERRATSGCSR